MSNSRTNIQNEIERIFQIQKSEISDFTKLSGSNIVYSFVVKNEKYFFRKLKDKSIIDWRPEKEAYKALEAFNITDELVFCEDGIKITKFLHDCKNLTYDETDIIETLELIRKVHESGATISYDYNIIENMDKYIKLCDKNSKKLDELINCRDKINTIQAIINKLNIKPVLCCDRQDLI